MKITDRNRVSHLEDLPNIGKAMAEDFRLIGVNKPDDIIGKDPFIMYEELCKITQKRHDPCVLDVFMAAVHFMEAGESLPWWKYTDERKRLILSGGRKK